MKKLLLLCLAMFGVTQLIAGSVEFPKKGSVTSRKYRDAIIFICDQKIQELHARIDDLYETLKKIQENQIAMNDVLKQND